MVFVGEIIGGRKLSVLNVYRFLKFFIMTKSAGVHCLLVAILTTKMSFFGDNLVVMAGLTVNQFMRFMWYESRLFVGGWNEWVALFILPSSNWGRHGSQKCIWVTASANVFCFCRDVAEPSPFTLGFLMALGKAALMRWYLLYIRFTRMAGHTFEGRRFLRMLLVCESLLVIFYPLAIQRVRT